MDLLESIPDEDRRRLLASAHRRRYARREVIFHEGDPADTLHLIVKGQVAVHVTLPSGDSATLDLLGPGDPLGELALLPPVASRSATARALVATDTMAVTASSFAALRAEFPSVTEFVLSLVVARNRILNGRLSEALYLPVEARLIRRLLDVAARFGTGDDRERVALSQDDLAGLAGTTRETANRILNQLAGDAIVHVGRGSVVLLDLERLRRKAGVRV